MIPRYSVPEMAAVWSDEARFRHWLEIEVLAVEADAGGIAEFAEVEEEAPVGRGGGVEGQRVAGGAGEGLGGGVFRGGPRTELFSGIVGGERGAAFEEFDLPGAGKGGWVAG